MNEFKARFDATQLGKLAQDPVMKPFAEDLGNQLRSRFGDTDIQLGLKWEDLSGIYAGEACLARIQPGGKAGEHATAMLIDVTGKDQQIAKVKATIDANMEKRKATKKSEKIMGFEVTVYQLKREIGEREQREVILGVVENQLLLINHREEATALIGRIKQDGTDILRDAVRFSEVMKNVADESKQTTPHVRWFVDPFTYAEVVRSARGQRRRRGKDLRQILQSQGFDAIQAIGGHINLATDGLEALHRTSVYAPPVNEETKYQMAARMLDFPAAKQLPTEKWVPRKLATFASFNWKIRSAFEHSISLIDEYVGSENFVEDVLEDFEKAKDGPKINVRDEILDFLGEHVIMFSDYNHPMTTKSERVFVAISVVNEAKVADSLRRFWQDGADPTVEKREYKEHVIWEVIPEEEEKLDINLLPGSGADEDEKDVLGNAGGPAPNAAMTVARGYLLVSTHLDYLKMVLDDRQKFDSIEQAVDFQFVNKKLNQLGAGVESFRFFSRMDEEYESAYEMIKQGKMPESESMLGRMLNRLLGPEDEGLRKQEVDGSKMPEYDIVRRYLGPSGSFVKPREDGWFITGVVLNKAKLVKQENNEVGALTTSK